MVGLAKEGISLEEIDTEAESLIYKLGGKSYNKGYKPEWSSVPFPTATSISVNNEICHGIPDKRTLKSGDIVNFDVGIVDSFGNCGDAGISVGIGEISNKDRHLLKYCKRALYSAIACIRAGVSTTEIAREIQTYAIRHSFKVNRKFAGHTIGSDMHESPTIYNSIEPHCTWAILKEGQVICIEPMFTHGRDDIGIQTDNGWTHVTSDGKNCAQFEHMVLVKNDGYEILTDHIREDE